MLLRLQHRFFCLLCSGLNSQNEMCLSFLSKAWFNSVFQRVKYSTRFESWWHMKYLAAIASWIQALCLFNLMGDIAPLFMVCILPLSSLLCCDPEDPTILCCVLVLFPWRTRSLVQLLSALAQPEGVWTAWESSWQWKETTVPAVQHAGCCGLSLDSSVASPYCALPALCLPTQQDAKSQGFLSTFCQKQAEMLWGNGKWLLCSSLTSFHVVMGFGAVCWLFEAQGSTCCPKWLALFAYFTPLISNSPSPLFHVFL